MQRKLPFRSCRRRSLPPLLRAQILLRQKGCCFDCGTRMMLGKIVFDHRPPLALRGEGENANDPDRLVAVCRTCDQRKTPRDAREIARTKRLALDHQDFINRMCDKVPGRPVPSRVNGTNWCAASKTARSNSHLRHDAARAQPGRRRLITSGDPEVAGALLPNVGCRGKVMRREFLRATATASAVNSSRRLMAQGFATQDDQMI